MALSPNGMKFFLEMLKVPVPAYFVASSATIVTIMTTFICTTNYMSDLLHDPNTQAMHDTANYDFIVVGGGSAGAIVAHRLSAYKEWKVLLLEAGGDPTVLNTIPALFSFNLYHPETDWGYTSVPQKNCSFTSPDQKLGLGRGKMLGGSSALNCMIYQRGNPMDFNNWGKITGDPSWNYENVLPFFKMSEKYSGHFPDGAEKYHGTKGLFAVTKQTYKPFVQEWIDAAKEMGLNSSDSNAEQTSTFVPTDTAIENGRRVGTYTAFLEDIIPKRKNLVVIRYAMVDKIEIKDKKAGEVVYTKRGKRLTAKASKEIILSAGAYGSPSILQRSGVGCSKLLNKLNIPVQVELKGVGKNLQDHVLTFIGPIPIKNEATPAPPPEPVGDPEKSLISNYITTNTGPLGSNGVSAMGFFSTEEPKNPTWPNICAFFMPMGAVDSSLSEYMERLCLLKEGVLEPFIKQVEGKRAVNVVINLARPESRGTVEIPSKNPEDMPIIDSNFYSDPGNKDVAHMVKGFAFFVDYFNNTNVWRKLGAQPEHAKFPGCEHFNFGTNDYYECYIRRFTASTWHGCCTNQMGAENNEMAVVDSKLRVRGIKGLRIADASVMPVITNANLNAPVMMIAEMVANFIIKEYIKDASKMPDY